MKQCIVTSEQLDEIDFIPTVIFGFYEGGNECHFTDVSVVLMQRFPNVDMLGCSSESNIYNHMPHIAEEEETLCVFLCLDVCKSCYHIELYSMESVPKMLKEHKQHYGALMFCSRYFSNLEKVVYDLQDQKHVKPLFGAVAGISSHSNKKCGTVFFNGSYYESHVLLWLINQEKYLLEGTSSHHFQPVGFDLEVSKANDTFLYEIEGRPALEVLEEVVGEISDETIKAFDHPLFLKEYADIPFKDSPLCAIRSVNRKEGSICLYRSIQERYKLKVGVSLSREEQEMQLASFRKFGKRKNAVAFLFNCIGIKANLGLMEFVYLMDIKKKLHTPLIGFHSFGEIGTTNMEHYSMLHNQTISIAVLSEKDEGEVWN